MKFFYDKKKICISLAVIIAVGVGGSYAWKTYAANKKPTTIQKKPDISQVQKGALDQRITASGTTVAADINSIFIELSQEVKEVFAEVGDYVEKGQLLVTYDIEDTKRELENKLKSAEISVENQQIQLDDLANPATGAELLDLESQVITAQNNFNTAKKDYENNKELFAISAITQTELDDSLINFENAKLALEKAQLNLENGKNKLNDSSVANDYKKQQNLLETAKMDLETAKNNLDKLTEATYSPINGTVIKSNAVEGQMLTDSTVMMEVADLTNLDVEAYVSEYDIAKVKVGQRVELTSDGIEGVVYHGVVTKIEPTASSQSTISGSEIVVPIVVHMEDNDELVKPGFTFDLEIIVVDLPEETEYIPISSVMKDKETDETYVFEVDENDMIKKTVVQLGTYSDMFVEFLGGLNENSRFITSPTEMMVEGTPLDNYTTTININGKEERNESSSILDNLTGAPAMPSGGGAMVVPMGGSKGGR